MTKMLYGKEEKMSEVKENKMGTMPVGKLLFTMSLPMVISMLVQALYNVVDSIFVAKISENALTAVSMAFPVQNFMIAVASGTGVGVNALLSRSLGEKNEKRASAAACNGILLVLISFAAFALFGLFGSEAFYRSQFSAAELAKNPDGCEEIIKFGVQYMQIITIFSLGIFMQIIFERLLMSTGKTIFNMITQGTGAIINIVLDPVLIFGLLGFPKLGVAGAAVATVIGQFVGFILGFIFNMKFNHEINISLKKLKPQWDIIKLIYSVGLPSIIMLSIGSVMTYGMNKILMLYTSTAVSVFGVYFKLQSFIFMPVFGLNNGMVPIVAYNYGAKSRERIIKTIKYSIFAAIVIMFTGLAVFQLIPETLLSLFMSENSSAEFVTIGVDALRKISLSFLFAGFCIVVGSVFQALGNGVYSLIVSAARQLIVILPVAYAFGEIFGLSAIWFAIPIAEIASVALSIFFFVRIYKKKISVLNK